MGIGIGAVIDGRGPTERARLSGKPARNASNKAERASWMKGELDTFPRHTCNGKRNRLK